MISRDLLTVREAADYLSASPNTITIWCRTGKLPAIKIGGRWRVSKSAIERHIDLAAAQVGLSGSIQQANGVFDGSMPFLVAESQNNHLSGNS